MAGEAVPDFLFFPHAPTVALFTTMPMSKTLVLMAKSA
jgi:hypothetical protein